MLEYSTNYSVGRGTEFPFERVGADWMKGRDFASCLAGRQIPGCAFTPLKFTPTSSNFAGASIEGVGFEVTDRGIFSSSRLGLEVAMALRRLYPGRIVWNVNKSLIGNSGVIAALGAAADATTPAEKGLAQFRAGYRQNYLIYR